MQSAFRALFVAWALLGTSAAGGHQAQGSSADGTAGAAQSTPAPQKPRRPSVFDVIKTVVPPLIDAATKPKEATEPAPQTGAEPAASPKAEPTAAPVAAEPLAATPTSVTPGVVTAPSPPPIEVPRPAPSETAPAASSVAQQLPSNVPRPAATLPSAPGNPAIAESRPSLDAPPALSAEPVRPTATEATADVGPAIVLADPAVESGKPTWLLLGLLALAAAAAAGLMRLNRMRQVARTRSLLSLDARLERTPARSPLAVQASLIVEPAHG